MTAHLAPRWKAGTLIFVFLAVGGWGVHHAFATAATVQGEPLPFRWVFLASYLMLATQMSLAYLERAKYDSDNSHKEHIAVILPVYNEDAGILREALQALLSQTRLPDTIVVIDDGSEVSYDLLKTTFLREAMAKQVEVKWHRTDNYGKRHAQAEGVRMTPNASIYCTLDSDSALDPRAVEQGELPFVDSRVSSVCGIVLSANVHHGLLTRIVDLIFVVQQMTDRSSMSRLGQVLVNSGTIAFYRADVIRNSLDAYLNEKFLGKRIEVSDDSMLTLYALSRGRTVQHPRIFGFSYMPENLPHHWRQQVRWTRGSFIRSVWRLRYLPILSFGYWRQLLGWAQILVTTTVAFTIVVLYPLIEQRVMWEYGIVAIAIGYGQALRYLTFRRSDLTFWQQLTIFALGPLAWVWQVTFLRVTRFYGALTCRKNGWGTRQKVEVNGNSIASEPSPEGVSNTERPA